MTDSAPAYCYHGLSQYSLGAMRQEGCSDCYCGEAGEWDCLTAPCCLYVDHDGATKRAHPTEYYSDGCNFCRCAVHPGSGEVLHLCSRRACPDKSEYRNWDGVTGHADVGEIVYVMGESEGGYECPKICKCEKNDEGKAEVDCNIYGEEEPCLAFD